MSIENNRDPLKYVEENHRHDALITRREIDRLRQPIIQRMEQLKVKQQTQPLTSEDQVEIAKAREFAMKLADIAQYQTQRMNANE